MSRSLIPNPGLTPLRRHDARARYEPCSPPPGLQPLLMLGFPWWEASSSYSRKRPMRVILFDCLSEKRVGFHPLSLSRPIFELRCGIGSLGEKLLAASGRRGGGVFCAGLHGRRLSGGHPPTGEQSGHAPGRRTWSWSTGASNRTALPPRVCRPPAQAVLPSTVQAKWRLVRSRRAIWAGSRRIRSARLLESARAVLPAAGEPVARENIWELVLENPGAAGGRFCRTGRRGIEGALRSHRPFAVTGRTFTSPLGRSSTRWWSSTPTRDRSISTRALRFTPSPGSRVPATSGPARPAGLQVPPAAIRSVQCAGWAARSKNRSFRAIPTGIATAFSATPMSANGSTSAL